MRRVAAIVIGVIVLGCVMHAYQRSADADKVWSLEEDYWRYVKANDLDGYRGLWHPDFLGWPFSSPEPARKAQITDWITTHTSRGERVKEYQLERLKVQVTNNLATTTYRIRFAWVDKNGTGQPETTRIIHTWVRDGDNWRIFSGMSAPARDGK